MAAQKENSSRSREERVPAVAAKLLGAVLLIFCVGAKTAALPIHLIGDAGNKPHHATLTVANA